MATRSQNDDCFTAFRTWLTGRGKSSNTQRAYVGDLKTFLRWMEQHPDLTTLTPTLETRPTTLLDLDDHEVFWSLAGHFLQDRSFHGVNKAHRCKHALSAWARFSRWPSAPDDLTLAPKQEAEHYPPLPDLMDGVDKMLGQCALDDFGWPTEALLVTMLGRFGMRLEEAVELRGSDIDREKRQFLVRTTTKGNKVRRIPIGGDDNWALIEQMASHVNWGDAPLIRFGKSWAYKRVVAIARAAGYEGIGPHNLRATFATALYRATNDIHLVSKLLGHSDTKITETMYVAPNVDAATSWMNALSEAA